MKFKATFLLATIIGTFLLLFEAKASTNQWEAYQRLLAKLTTEIVIENQNLKSTHTAIDYDLLKNLQSSQSLLKQQQNLLKTTEPPIERKAKLAFWINSYNFFTLVDVSEHYPIKSMKDIGWKQQQHIIAGKKYSLDQIENEILRPMKDPRIHFAINCASTSCPSLKASPYTASSIDSELDQAARNALSNPIHLQAKKDWFGKEYLSSTQLFKWFKTDFETKPYGSVINFIHKYSPAQYQKISEYKADISYNWLLNNQHNIKMELNKHVQQ